MPHRPGHKKQGKKFALDRKAVKKEEFEEGAAAQIGKGSLKKAKKKEEEVAKGTRERQGIPEIQEQEVTQPEVQLPEPEGKADKFLVGDIGGKKIDLRNLQVGNIGGTEVSPELAVGAAATAIAITAGSGVVAINAIQKANQAASVTRIASVAGTDTATVTKVIKAAGTPTKIVGGLTAASIANTGFKGAGAIAGADVLVTWYALDNVITGQKFFVKDMLKALQEGTISPEVALKNLKSSQETRETAISLVNTSAMLNPLLWPFRELIMTGVEADEATLGFLEGQIEQLAGQKVAQSQAQERADAIKRVRGITPAGG